MLATETLLQILAITAAGFGAGFINVIVGSGTLITFPVLLMFGVPALSANMSSNLGLAAGNFSGVWGYRQEIARNATIAKKLIIASAIGGVIGAVLLLRLPASVFDFVVPILVAVGVLMVAIAPLVQKRTAAKLAAQGASSNNAESQRMTKPVLTFAIVLLLGIYGGYFGAAQGVLLVGFLGMLLTISLQSLNAVKNLLAATVNVLSAIIFTVFAFDHINWWVVLLIAIGSTLGGLTGAKIGRRLPPNLLRGVIIVVGIIALVNMLV